MSRHHQPKKPPRFPSHFVFPKHGPVRPVVEPLPRTQDELELAIGQKFLGALRHFHDIHLRDLTRGAEPADLRCADADGRLVSIQVVEAVSQRLRQLTEMRKAYLAALQEHAESIFASFSGCAVEMVDTGDPPYLPTIGTDGGRRCFEQIRVEIQRIGRGIGELPVGRLTPRDIHITDPERTLSLLITRHEEPTTPDRFTLTWGGGGPGYRTDVPRDILPAAVRSKLAKHYSTTLARFILLAYSIDTLLAADDPDVTEAQRLLAANEHPFDEAWYLYPYAETTLGHLVRLWPAERAG